MATDAQWLCPATSPAVGERYAVRDADRSILSARRSARVKQH